MAGSSASENKANSHGRTRAWKQGRLLFSVSGRVCIAYSISQAGGISQYLSEQDEHSVAVCVYIFQCCLHELDVKFGAYNSFHVHLRLKASRTL